MKLPKVKKILSYSLKILLFGVLFGLIYWQMKSRSNDFSLIENFKKSFSWQQFPFLFAAVLLMPVNIFLESTKWRLFVNEFQKDFDIVDALKSMLCGSFFGFISPNRVGEFLGRLNRIDKGSRSRALTAGYWGGLAQFLVTFSFGIYMGGRAIMHHADLKSLDVYTIPAALTIIFLVSLVYFNLKWVLKKVSSFPCLRKLTAKYPLEYDVPKEKLLLILLVTVFRYLVYVSQYIYLLYFFGVDLAFGTLFSAVSTMLVIHTMFPSVPFIDLGVKGSALVLILENSSHNELGIGLAVFSIWIINIIIPAIFGYYFFAINKKQENLDEDEKIELAI